MLICDFSYCYLPYPWENILTSSAAKGQRFSWKQIVPSCSMNWSRRKDERRVTNKASSENFTPRRKYPQMITARWLTQMVQVNQLSWLQQAMIMPLSFGKHTAEYVTAQSSILILYLLQMRGVNCVVYFVNNEYLLSYYWKMGQKGSCLFFGDFCDNF